MTVRRAQFGALENGAMIEAVELSNRSGVMARIITLGATLQSLATPDKNGRAEDIVLGYASAREYVSRPQYFGITAGRYANRIANGTFVLEGKRYTLETNDGPNHLHGGKRGLDQVVWSIEATSDGPEPSVTLAYTSPDGDGGYPGTLTTHTIYSLNEQNELSIEYRARTDKPTIVNITHHSYFNLGGEEKGGDVMSHVLTLHADAFTPVNETMIPTGEIRKVAGTAFDFRQPHTIGARIRQGRDEQILRGRGYDHNFVLNGESGKLRLAARVEELESGRALELLTTAPGLQFYSGNFLDGTSAGKSGRVYRQGDGFCLEPQTFPDSPNRAEFPSARLNPGETYVNKMVFRLLTTASR